MNAPGFGPRLLTQHDLCAKNQNANAHVVGPVSRPGGPTTLVPEHHRLESDAPNVGRVSRPGGRLLGKHSPVTNVTPRPVGRPGLQRSTPDVILAR